MIDINIVSIPAFSGARCTVELPSRLSTVQRAHRVFPGTILSNHANRITPDRVLNDDYYCTQCSNDGAIIATKPGYFLPHAGYFDANLPKSTILNKIIEQNRHRCVII